jgi:hypothetical protein
MSIPFMSHVGLAIANRFVSRLRFLITNPRSFLWSTRQASVPCFVLRHAPPASLVYRCLMAAVKMSAWFPILITTFSAPSWGDTYEEISTPKADQAYSEDINIWVYTEAFAKRFAMPEQWIDNDLKGAYAVAFRVETSSERLMFPHKGPEVAMPNRRCILDVYIPADASIPWVDDRISDKWWYTPDSPTYLPPQSKEDWEWRTRPIGVPHAGVKARRPLMRLDGGSLSIREYDRKVYPGITYISFNMGCMTPGKQQATVEFCEDRYWGSGGRCTPMHTIVIPDQFMERLYGKWYAESRAPANTEWKGLLDNPK